LEDDMGGIPGGSRSFAAFSAALALSVAAHASTADAPRGCTPEWTNVPSPTVDGRNAGLGGLAVVSATDIWAVGTDSIGLDDRNTLIEHWDGVSWSIVPSPNGPNVVNFLVRAAAVSTGDVWAVGWSRTPGFSGISETLIERWNGQDWTVFPSPNPQPPGPYEWSNELFGIAAVNDHDIWAVGQTYDFTGGQSLILHYDGQEWTEVDHPHPGLGGVLYGVTALATDKVWAVGNSYFDGLQQSVVQEWDGQEWTVVPSANVGPFLNTFLNVWATTPTDIWAVGYHLAVFGFSEVYQTSMIHFDGQDWSVSATPNQNQLNNYLWDVVALSDADAWAVGFYDTGTELKTMIQHFDGGNWTIVPSPNGDGGYITELVALGKVTPNDVWAVGQAFDGFQYFATYVQQYSCGVVLPPPSVASIAPGSGPAAGGTAVVVTGSSFVAGAGLDIGGVPASDVVVDATSIQATTPPLSPGTLNDVVVTNPDTQLGSLSAAFFADFLDVAQDDPFHGFVETLIRSGVTAGCGGGDYCRDTAVTRAQMAVFLLKGKLGADHVPPACTGTVFADVPCTGGTFDPWIEELASLGVTGGCGGGNYCPDAAVTREQMAVFLLKTKNGSSFDPPDCTGVFDDVPCTPGVGFPDWIEQLYADGVTGGCSAAPPLYCPAAANTRGQMAVFLVKNFGL
jgi:hypothetical protein